MRRVSAALYAAVVLAQAPTPAPTRASTTAYVNTAIYWQSGSCADYDGVADDAVLSSAIVDVLGGYVTSTTDICGINLCSFSHWVSFTLKVDLGLSGHARAELVDNFIIDFSAALNDGDLDTALDDHATDSLMLASASINVADTVPMIETDTSLVPRSEGEVACGLGAFSPTSIPTPRPTSVPPPSPRPTSAPPDPAPTPRVATRPAKAKAEGLSAFNLALLVLFGGIALGFVSYGGFARLYGKAKRAGWWLPWGPIGPTAGARPVAALELTAASQRRLDEEGGAVVPAEGEAPVAAGAEAGGDAPGAAPVVAPVELAAAPDEDAAAAYPAKEPTSPGPPAEARPSPGAADDADRLGATVPASWQSAGPLLEAVATAVPVADIAPTDLQPMDAFSPAPEPYGQAVVLGIHNEDEDAAADLPSEGAA